MRDVYHARLAAVALRYLRDANGGHQIDHTRRVVMNIVALARNYPQCDMRVLAACAWLHDIGRPEETPTGMCHALISARHAERELPALGYAPVAITRIVRAIADHRYATGTHPANMEGCLLQDADRLDALGALGIARALMHDATRLLYDADDPWAERRPLDDARYVIDHFFSKLFHLPDTLHTEAARSMAKERIRTMQVFLAGLSDEIGIPLPSHLVGDSASTVVASRARPGMIPPASG